MPFPASICRKKIWPLETANIKDKGSLFWCKAMKYRISFSIISWHFKWENKLYLGCPFIKEWWKVTWSYDRWFVYRDRFHLPISLRAAHGHLAGEGQWGKGGESTWVNMNSMGNQKPKWMNKKFPKLQPKPSNLCQIKWVSKKERKKKNKTKKTSTKNTGSDKKIALQENCKDLIYF